MAVSPIEVTEKATPRRGEVSPPAKSQLNARLSEIGEKVESSGDSAAGETVAFDQGVRCVGKRVDALVIAFKVLVRGAVANQITAQRALANEVGAAELRIGSFRFALRRGRQERLPFENADIRGMYDALASGGFVLELTARATFLATRSLSESVGLLTRIARAFGVLRDTRLRRFDLAADYAGFQLSPGDIDRVVTTRARLQAFRADPKDVDEAAPDGYATLREHRDSTLQVTGITVAAGNPLMARVYAKDVELKQPGREGKRAMEHQIWRENGWNGIDSVTRVEFQCRGVFLDEIQLRDPRALEAKLDAVFQLCVRWLRFIEPESNPRRIRCRLDPWWQVVSNTVFAHEAAPLARSRRHRGGARPAHVSGAVQSALASIGLLGPPELVTREGEVFEDETRFAMALDPAGAEGWVRRKHAEMFAAASNVCAAEVLSRFGPRGAVRAVAARTKATIARFSSTDASPRDEGDDP